MTLAQFPPNHHVIPDKDGRIEFHRRVFVGDEEKPEMSAYILAAYEDDEGNVISIEPDKQLSHAEEALANNGYEVVPPDSDQSFSSFTKEQVAIATGLFEVKQTGKEKK